MNQVTKHKAEVVALGGSTAAATITAGRALRAGNTITTLGGTYVVAEANDGAPPGANRHQRRAAAAKRRHHHANP